MPPAFQPVRREGFGQDSASFAFQPSERANFWECDATRVSARLERRGRWSFHRNAQKILLLRKHQIVRIGGVADTYTGRVEVHRNLFGGVAEIMPEFLLAGECVPNTLQLGIVGYGRVMPLFVDEGNSTLAGIGETVAQPLSSTE